MREESQSDSFVDMCSRDLPRPEVAECILGVREGSILALSGIDGEDLRALLDSIEPNSGKRRALFARIAPASTAETIISGIIDLLAETARLLWPVWFTDTTFVGCRNDTLGHLAAGIIARNASQEIAGLSASWAEAAARLALDGRHPRVRGTPPAQELAQLTSAISRTGLALVADVAPACESFNPAAVVHALEWTARNMRGAVIALFSELPPNEPPYDHILYGARRVIAVDRPTDGVTAPNTPEASSIAQSSAAWIAPWRGTPHPLSETEQRLAKALDAGAELAPLFGFNLCIETIRGSRPKVDLLWKEGRLVIEIDGYESHGNRAAFMYDRHRDYELILSGYTVLRLANDEIAQDIEKAVEKIRDLVRLCRTRLASEI